MGAKILLGVYVVEGPTISPPRGQKGTFATLGRKVRFPSIAPYATPFPYDLVPRLAGPCFRCAIHYNNNPMQRATARRYTRTYSNCVAINSCRVDLGGGTMVPGGGPAACSVRRGGLFLPSQPPAQMYCQRSFFPFLRDVRPVLGLSFFYASH